MACQSLTSLPLVCGSEGLQAGIQRLYMIAYNDLATVASSTLNYALATNGVVNQIGLDGSKTFVEIGTLKNVNGLDSAGVFNENGTQYETITFTTQLTDITPEHEAFVDSVKGQEVAVIVQSKSSKYFVAGIHNGLKMSALTKSVGKADSDLIGYTMTFTGNDTLGIKLVEPAIAMSSIG